MALAVPQHILWVRANKCFVEKVLSARRRRPEVKLADMVESMNIFEFEVSEGLEQDIEDEEVRRPFEELTARRAEEVVMKRDIVRNVSELIGVALATGASSSSSAGSAAAPAKLRELGCSARSPPLAVHRE